MKINISFYLFTQFAVHSFSSTFRLFHSLTPKTEVPSHRPQGNTGISVTSLQPPLLHFLDICRQLVAFSALCLI